MKLGKFHDGNYYYEGAEKPVSIIICKIHDIRNNYEFMVSRFDEVEKACQDILHYIEFADLSANHGYKAYKKLQELRIERRLLKEEIEEVKIAYEILNSTFVDSLVKNLSQVQSKCKKAEINFDKHYNIRNSELSGISLEKFKEIENAYNSKLKEIIIKK